MPRVDLPPPPDLTPGGQGSKPLYVGVADDYTVSKPAVASDYFKPGGATRDTNLGIAGYGTEVPNPTISRTPQYAYGSESAIASLSTENMARLQIRLARAGLIGPSTRVTVGVADDATISAYKELLGIANRYAVSDSDALAMIESDPSLGGTSGSDLITGGADAGPQSYTNTSTQRFSNLDAETMADRAYQDALGQDASPAQRKALKAALNAYAKANPSVTTGTDDGQGNTTSTTKGGIDAAGVQQIATNQAKANPHFAEVQAATTYMNALESALGATADVGI